LRFQIVMQHTSVSEAARHLATDHSAISAQIRQLERDLGAKLYYRRFTSHGTPLQPTTTGRAVLNALTTLTITPLTTRKSFVMNKNPSSGHTR
jgi:DNA-binding transcriptional LysR family regulator